MEEISFKELLRKIEKEEKELGKGKISPELIKNIEDNLPPEIVYKGLDRIKWYLSSF